MKYIDNQNFQNDNVLLISGTRTITSSGTYKLSGDMPLLTITGSDEKAVDAMVYIQGNGYTINRCVITDISVNFVNCIFGDEQGLASLSNTKYTSVGSNDPTLDYGYWGSALVYSNTPLSLLNCEFLGSDVADDNTQTNSGMVGLLLGDGVQGAEQQWRSSSSRYRAHNSKINNCRFTNLRVGVVLREFYEYNVINNCVFSVCNAGIITLAGNSNATNIIAVYCGAGMIYAMATTGTFEPNNQTGYGSAVAIPSNGSAKNSFHSTLNAGMMNHCYRGCYVVGRINETAPFYYDTLIASSRFEASTIPIDVVDNEMVQVIGCHIRGNVTVTNSTARCYLMSSIYEGETIVSGGKLYLDTTSWRTSNFAFNSKLFSASEDTVAPDVFTGTTEPSLPTTGSMYFDTSTSRLRVYNGSAWKFVAFS